MNAGSIELMAGDPAAAERALRPAVDALFAMGETNYLMGTAYYLASSLCEQGRDGDAEQVVESARAAVSPGNDQTEAVFGLVKARLHARRGELDQAERLALEGRRCLGGYGSRWLGEALLTHGEVLELAGKLDEATAVFGEALALYETRRAAPLAERARTALQRVDDRPVPTG
jgi:tetratricopeptide (TPR) repeat protein